MEGVLKSDIFFFVTTICIVLVTLFVIFLIIHALSILADVKQLSKKFKEEGQEFINDAKEMRIALREKGNSLLGLVSAIFGASKRKHQSKK